MWDVALAGPRAQLKIISINETGLRWFPPHQVSDGGKSKSSLVIKTVSPFPENFKSSLINIMAGVRQWAGTEKWHYWKTAKTNNRSRPTGTSNLELSLLCTRT